MELSDLKLEGIPSKLRDENQVTLKYLGQGRAGTFTECMAFLCFIRLWLSLPLYPQTLQMNTFFCFGDFPPVATVEGAAAGSGGQVRTYWTPG